MGDGLHVMTMQGWRAGQGAVGLTVCVGFEIRNEASVIQSRTWEVKMETARISAAGDQSQARIDRGGHGEPFEAFEAG